MDKYRHFLALILLLAAGTARAADVPAFPFVLPWDDASPGLTDMSGMLEKPAGAAGFITAKAGHLYEGEKRFRIFGVNTAFSANFPTHADAEKIAARMAKLGINCVRLHHMDNQAAPNGIWSADMRTINPEQLDRLDYFIAQLKKNGIYVDINLHVSREYPGMQRWQGMPVYFKGLDLFYPPMIAMQKDYARELLTHVNPYAGAAYVDDPGVAIIEINNEDGLIEEWWNGALDAMPEPYRAEFQSQWNAWLGAKYPKRDALAAAWSAGEQPLGAEMLKDTHFENGAGGAWNLEQHDSARATATGSDGLAVKIDQTDGVNWHIQLIQRGIALSKAMGYTLAFSGRADKPRRISIYASQAHAPWSPLWMGNVELGPELKDYRLTFRPSADDANARISFGDLGANETGVFFNNVSLRTGGVSGLQPGEPLGSVPVFSKANLGMRTEAAQRDWMAFLFDTETRYWTGMRQFLKQDLKAYSLIVGTSSPFSPGVIQSAMDVVDGHAYWQHPQFPGKPWDMSNWTVKNVPMAGDPGGGTLPSLAGYRVEGKPYICTEYNEAAPNPHASEALLLLGAYAALQDWDGVFVFAYSHSNENWDSRQIGSFFNIDQNPGKLVTLPAAETMFRRGDVLEARRLIGFPVTREDAMRACMDAGVWWSLQRFGMTKLLPLVSRVAQISHGGRQPVQPVETAVVKSDTGELTWDTEQGRVLIDSPRNKAVIGNIRGPVKLGDITIEPLPDSLGWSAITATEIKPRDWLITATGYEENTGMKWTSPAMESVETNWGTAPSRVEGISARITAPWSGVKAFALDERGHEGKQLPVTKSAGGSTVEIGPAYQTLWYEVRY